MGTDIHSVFQAKLANGKWIDVPTKYDEGRHYYLFAWLADVRNGYGFAGVRTHDPITPLSLHRGLPDDFEVDQYGYHPSEIACYRTSMNGTVKWMGDHSFTWLTADEILSATPPHSTTQRSGIVELSVYHTWKESGNMQPESWCGGVDGPNVVVSEESEINDSTTHVRCMWDIPGSEFDYFIDEVKRLVDEYGEVRMVMGFDS